MKLLRYYVLSLFLLLSWVVAVPFLHAQIDTKRVTRIGLNALQYRDYVLAIEHFNRVIDASPNTAEPYYYRALAKFLLGDYSGAAVDASAALQRNKFLSRAYQLRGTAYQSLRKDSLAVIDYRTALGIMPDDPHLRFNLAGALYSLKQYQAADSVAGALLARYPHYSRAAVLQAEIKLAHTDTLAAQELMQSLVRQDSATAAPYRILGMIAYTRQDYPAAVLYYSHAIDREPDYIADYVNRGLAYYKSNNLREALNDYNVAVDLSPADPTARYNRALLLHYVGDNQAALADFLSIAAVQPDNMPLLYNIALLEHQEGMYRQAIRHYNTILARYPAFTDGYYQRSEAKRLLGDIKGADQDYWYAYDIERGAVHPPKQAHPDTHSDTAQRDSLLLAQYNRLIEHAPQPTVMADDSSPIRGAVQDKAQDIRPYPSYAFTLFSDTQAQLLPKVNYLPELDNYNLRNKPLPRILLSNADAPLDSADLAAVLNDIQALQVAQTTPPDSLFRSAVQLSLLREYDRAIALLNTCINTNSSFALAYMARAYVRTMMQDPKTLPQSDTDSSLTGVGGATSLGMTESLSGSVGTTLAGAAGSLNLAVRDLEQAIALSPANGYAYFNLALLTQQTALYDKAIEYYTQAIQLLPDPAPAYFNRALLYLRTDNKDRAIQDLSQAGQGGLYKAYRLIKSIQQQ